jgi:REP element-mobilizing transposase RayT
MKYDPFKHHRRSIRLKGYDYAQAGAYYVTSVTQNRLCLFGDVVNGEMELNDAGRTVERWWLELNNKYPTVETDEYVVMPNHFHGIVVIDESEMGQPHRVAPTTNVTGDDVGATLRGRPDKFLQIHNPTLGDIMDWFKTMTTNEYIRGVKERDWQPFYRKLWQRNYWEHIVRNEKELERIRTYVINNPTNWDTDNENPKNIPARKC